MRNVSQVRIQQILRVDAKESNASEKKESALALYATNLNESAKKGVIDPLVGRDRRLKG